MKTLNNLLSSKSPNWVKYVQLENKTSKTPMPQKVLLTHSGDNCGTVSTGNLQLPEASLCNSELRIRTHVHTREVTKIFT